VSVLAFYADESGSFSVRDPGQPWVVLLAIGFDDDNWTLIDDALNDLKRLYFPDCAPSEVEIGSNDLRMAHVRPSPRNPFSRISATTLRAFGADLYSVIDSLPFAWCVAVLNKPMTARRFTNARADDLFAIAYLELLGALDRWCASVGTVGRLFLDQRERGLHGKAHDAIVEVHDQYRDDAGLHKQPRVIERPYFHDSARSNHIQVADIIAYNVLRRVRDGDEHYSYFRRIMAKKHCVEETSENDETG
jgi:uncharacterized protein DUF3800